MKEWITTSGYKIIQVLSGRSNVFLLTDGRSHILVDSGPGFMWNTLRRRLMKLHVVKIDLLFLTHSHFDHAANAGRIRDNFNAQIIIHRCEAAYLASGDNVVPVGTNAIAKFLTGLFAKRFMSVARYRPCVADHEFDTFFDLSFTGIKAYLMHTPGHTPGSSSLIADNEIALVGDTMFGVLSGSVFPPFAQDIRQMLQSWKRLLETGCGVFLPSHGSARERTLVERDLKRRMTENIIFTDNDNQ